MNNGRIFLGIGIGASRVKIVARNGANTEPAVVVRDHLGNPRETTLEMLGRFDPSSVSGIAVTGGEGAALIRGRKVYECEAIEESLRLLGLKADAVLSLGGESFAAYPIDAGGKVLDYLSGNRCAAGTVEFFKQQLGRMGLGIRDGTELAADGGIVPLAKRCSVHCKSDCTHALNKNKCSVADIVHTLCHNMAEKAAGLLQNSGIARGRILVIGGASTNPVIVRYITQFLPDCEVSVPPHADCFEAFGASSIARTRSLPVPSRWPDMFAAPGTSFAALPPLSQFAGNVTILPSRRGKLARDAKYLLGIDGGSTTTKAVLFDFDRMEICAAHYTRTNGNPEKAMKECLRALRQQAIDAVGACDLNIVGTATTGSSGEILSVLCETPSCHNEIIAHAFGSSFYIPDVDTILEIGGQDSKFTLLRSKVAVDFNMNESCSAGTGSFIEEAARDDLGVKMEEIADLAIKSATPPRFSDQCAAFVNSDIRKASQEGASREDNLAGLVYAIVENYLTKVVGERKLGDHILFQGGTSKNKAIAYAFAAKTGKHITVPPDPELMGCFGIALWLRDKIVSGETPERKCNIDGMLASTVTESSEFTCKACSNFCTIHNMTINGHKYPFGGQCSKWENARNKREVPSEDMDLVERRNNMLFKEYGAPFSVEPQSKDPSKVMGIQTIFSSCSYFPLYSWFFKELGYELVLSEKVDPAGVRMCQSTRCYPYEIAHGTFSDLVKKGVKTVFIPHLVNMPDEPGASGSISCPIAQASPYYVRAAFADTGVKLLSPVLDMLKGSKGAEKAFVDMAISLGHGAEAASRAFRKGLEKQEAFDHAARKEGKAALERIEKGSGIGIVLVGRPYNAFMRIANMGVPRKFASRGVTIIPYDFLPLGGESTVGTMYWKYGQVILKSLAFVRKNPKLFPVFISNFGCGPDSFIQHAALALMGRKPMLYLELDSHTADAGIGTRVAAFLDIVSGYSRLGEPPAAAGKFRMAEVVVERGKSMIRTSSGELVPFKNPRVTFAFPSMNRLTTEAAAAAARYVGMNGLALPPVDDRVLAIGKAFTSGKECSPAVFTVGSLVSHCREQHKKRRPDEIMLFFMPTTTGPCRFGQYNVHMKEIIKSLELEDVAILSPSAANSYANLSFQFLMLGWTSMVVADLMRDIRAALKVTAVDRAAAMAVFDAEWNKVCDAISNGGARRMWTALAAAAAAFAKIPLSRDPAAVPRVLLTGEIYVRSDELSARGIDDYYADEGFIVKVADSMEWIYYTNWMHLARSAANFEFPRGILGAKTMARQTLKAATGDRHARKFVATRLKHAMQSSVEVKARKILSKSGLLVTGHHDIDDVVRAGSGFIHPALMGEAILTSGGAVTAFEHARSENYCGVIYIGPFNCMPTGIAESVSKPYFRKNNIPYLIFETDGGPLTPNFKSQMEVHLLRCKAVAATRMAQSAVQ